MDCEDSNPNSSSSGWIGDNYIDNRKNVLLKFCIVYNAYFEHINVDFAVLNLTTNLPWGVSRIMRYVDNEDDKNINKTIYDGNLYSGWFGDCWFGNNTRLSFYYFPRTSSNVPFPNLGISYGVFGNFGNQKGWIYTDDEDTKNANICYLELFTGTGYLRQYSGNIPNIMDVGNNTRLYLSQVH